MTIFDMVMEFGATAHYLIETMDRTRLKLVAEFINAAIG